MTVRTWSVRSASLLDIPAIVRFIEAQRPDDHPTIIRDKVIDHDTATSAARLILSHGPLDEGRLTIAEDEQGIAGVSVWMPSNGDDGTQLTHVLTREVGLTDPVLFDEELDLIEDTPNPNFDGFPDGLILILAVRRTDAAHDQELLTALMAPCFEDGSAVGAMVPAKPEVTEGLRELGFEHIGIIPTPTDVSLWVARRSA